MGPMKARLMQWRLPEKLGSDCEPQSQSFSRPWVKNRPMKTCVTPWNVSRKAESSGAPRAPLEAAGCGKEEEGMGYDTYPAFEPERNCSPPRSRAARRITEGEPKEKVK